MADTCTSRVRLYRHLLVFFFNDTATTEIYTLSLHDALPICGNLVAHVRMDKAWIGSVDIAINKAWTSRAFDISTKELAELSQSGDQFFGIHASNHGRVMIFAGGVPLKRGDEVVGAVGVSGGMGKQDQAVAEAGAEAF